MGSIRFQLCVTVYQWWMEYVTTSNPAQGEERDYLLCGARSHVGVQPKNDEMSIIFVVLMHQYIIIKR